MNDHPIQINPNIFTHTYIMKVRNIKIFSGIALDNLDDLIKR